MKEPNKMWNTKISHPHSKRKKQTKYINYKKNNKICQPWHKFHKKQKKKHTKKKFINCQVCQKKYAHLLPNQPPRKPPPPIQSTGGTSWALIASEISSNEATGGRTAFLVGRRSDHDITRVRHQWFGVMMYVFLLSIYAR